MANEIQKSNDEISQEISTSTQFISTVQMYHDNINSQTLTLLEKQYSVLDRLLGGALVKAARDQQLTQAKNEFELINRAHELKIEYTIDIIRNKCIANLTVFVSDLNAKVIVEVNRILNNMQSDALNTYYFQMKEYQAHYERAREFEKDEKLYPDYVNFIDKCKSRMNDIADSLLEKFKKDVDNINIEYSKTANKK